MIEEEVAAEVEAKTGEAEMVRTTKASSLSKKMETRTPEEEAEVVTEVTEAEEREAPGEETAKLVKPVKVPQEVDQDHQEVTDLQEPEPTRKVIFQVWPLQLLIQPQCLTSRWSEDPVFDLRIC